MKKLKAFIQIALLILLFISHDTFAGIPADNKSLQKDTITVRKYDIACFLAEGFPSVDSPSLDTLILKKAVAGFSVRYLRSVDDFNFLTTDNFKALILPYGSAFPVDAWTAIYTFLSSGGSLFYSGGYPFYQPVLRKEDDSSGKGMWVPGIPQVTYARMLHIGPADTILIGSTPFYQADAGFKVHDGAGFSYNDLSMPSKVFALTVRFTVKKDFTDEDGTSGPRDALLRPLVHILNGSGHPVAAPIIEIDKFEGSEAGARWIVAPSDAPLSEKVFRSCVKRMLEGASHLAAVPVNASIYPGEVPRIRVNRFYHSQHGRLSSERIIISITSPDGSEVYRKEHLLEGSGDFLTAEIFAAIDTKPGFYKAEITSLNSNVSPSKTITGFWVMDEKLLNKAPLLSVSKDWLLWNGKPVPIIGTTYMASDVHRKFLSEANPYEWNKDMEMMKREGINFIRTGIWTGWKRIMLDRGAFDESVLRALDAFILTAAKHDIMVCFTFFAFSPPLNGGSNPYLDPRALNWQKTFITMITSRYKDVNWIHYDLINEPSYSPPGELWNMLPVNDAYEASAWKYWINKKHKDINKLAGNWRCDIKNIYSVPNRNELSYSRIRENRLFRKSMDFAHFTQDVVTWWADTLSKVIKTNAGQNSLVTLGQDEGGTSVRPSQQFHYQAVDYTSMHTWWYNDDLLWDALFTKVPEKPNLISETGIMRLEDIDGNSWLNPSAAEKLLDRKFAFGFAGRAAGVVEWAWNINPYMPLDNEAVIGFIRPDGTYKQELSVLRKYADFFESAAEHLSDFENSEVVLVIPHSRIFSGRPSASLATQNLVRVLAEVFGIAPRMISEYKLSDRRLAGAKLVIVPGCEMLSDSAAVQLHRASLQGTKVLFTGAVEGNEYGIITNEFKLLGLNHESRPVSKYEPVSYLESSQPKFAVFDAGQTGYLLRSTSAGIIFNGNIIHEPVPVEMCSGRAPLTELLKRVFEYSGITSKQSDQPVSLSIHKTGSTALIVCVNESALNLVRRAESDGYSYDIPVEAGGSVLLLVNRKDGSIIASTSDLSNITKNNI